MLTLEEIENISFRKSSFGGYKTDDVDTFVDGVILKLKDLQTANKELENRIEQLNAQIKLFNEKQESVHDAIITAEMTSKSLIREATHRAEVLITDANTKAENIIKEATEKADKVLLESNQKAGSVINSAVCKSKEKINENNLILENQKNLIDQIQDEINRFKDSLIQSYRNHLEIINSLPRTDKLNQFQGKIDEYHAVSNDEQTDPHISSAVKGEEEKNNESKEFIDKENNETVFMSQKNDKIQEDVSEKNITSLNKREPVIVKDKP